MPNWVGYLITEYSPDNRLLVYDYAVGGDSVVGVRKQVQVNFLPRVGEKPSWAPWNAEDTLFSKFLPTTRPSFFFYSQFHHRHVHATLPVTWIGINDCAYVCSSLYDHVHLALNMTSEQTFRSRSGLQDSRRALR